MNPPPYNPYPNATAPPPPEMNKNQKVEKLIRDYEIDNLFSERLDILSNFEIVLIVDDSGSMNTPITNSKHATRWEELKEVVSIVVRISTIFDEDGIDINFLNRPSYDNVRDNYTINHILRDNPYGLTPLNNALQKVLDKYSDSAKPVLVVIATDGIPTDSLGYQDIETFTRTLKNRDYSKFYISFLACSDQENDVGYLNKLDRKIPNIDTLDDYNSELQEVRSAQGKKFKYSFGDHVVRLLLGPICPELDKLDEKKSCNCNIF